MGSGSRDRGVLGGRGKVSWADGDKRTRGKGVCVAHGPGPASGEGRVKICALHPKRTRGGAASGGAASQDAGGQGLENCVELG